MAQASDNFAGTGALSASWNNLTGAASRVAGKVVPTIAPAAYGWVGLGATPVFTADAFVEVTLTGVPASLVGACARYTSALSGYVVAATSGGQLVSYRSDSGALTALETLSGYTFVLGDEIGIEVVGTRIRIFYNGVPQGSGATDATYASANDAGFLLNTATDTIEFWEGQDVIADLIGLPSPMQHTGLIVQLCRM